MKGLWRSFFIFFFYSFFVALLIQKVLLPKAPQLHGGHGLLVQTDAIHFHDRAVVLSSKMHQEGWVAFWNRPKKDGPKDNPMDGIIGVAVDVPTVFYYFLIPEPWVLIPLNALLHALSGVLLILIVRKVRGRVSGSEWAALPLIFFPSTMAWVAQIHRDGYFILGFFSCIYAWLSILDKSAGKVKWLLLALGGYFLISLSRDYVLQIFRNLLPLTLLAGLLRNRGWKAMASQLPFLLAVFFLLKPFESRSLDSSEIKINFNKDLVAKKGGELVPWKESGLPKGVEIRLANIATQRDASRYRPGIGGSNIDGHIAFHKAKDIFNYLPRAFQIALFSPFPTQWFTHGETHGGGIMRAVSSVETLVVYVAFGFLLLGLPSLLSSLEFWIIAYFCSSLATLYSLTIINQGALYRYRFSFLMVLVGIGFSIVQDLSVRKKLKTLPLNS